MNLETLVLSDTTIPRYIWGSHYYNEENRLLWLVTVMKTIMTPHLHMWRPGRFFSVFPRNAINQVFDDRRALYDQLSEVVYVDMGGVNQDPITSAQVRAALDPGGRRGWWERGILKVQ